MSTVSPQLMTIDDVFQTVEQSGGGPQLTPPPPPGVLTEWTDDTSERECPHDDIGIRPRVGTIDMSEDRVPTRNIESPYGGGVRSLPGATGCLRPMKFPAATVLLADGPQLGSWQVAVVRGTLPDGSVPVLNRIGNGRLTCLKLLEMFVQCWPRCCRWPRWPV